MGENTYSESANPAIPSLADYPLVAANPQSLLQNALTSYSILVEVGSGEWGVGSGE